MGKKHFKISKRVIVGTLGVAGLLIAALVVGLVLQQVLNPAKKGVDVSPDASTGGVTDLPAQTQLPKEVVDIQNLRLEGKNDEAKQKIATALQDSSISDSTKYQLYLQQGISEETDQQLQAAYDSYQKAASLQKTREVYGLLADLDERLGKKQEAVEAYREAIKYISKDSPVHDAEQANYEQKIRDLGGQP